jgi:hypothetical protein
LPCLSRENPPSFSARSSLLRDWKRIFESGTYSTVCQTGRRETTSARKTLAPPSASRRSARTRDNQILARRNCPHEGGRAEKATSRGARRRRHPRSYRASRGEARPTPARARPPRGRVWCGNARKSPKGRVGRLLGIGDCAKTRGPHVFRASRPRLGSSACVINDVRARYETPGVEREERDGVFRPLRPLEDRVRRASRIQLTGRGGAARERRAPVVRARGTAPPKFLRARSRVSHASPRDHPLGRGRPASTPRTASRPPVVRISSERTTRFFGFSRKMQMRRRKRRRETRPASRRRPADDFVSAPPRAFRASKNRKNHRTRPRRTPTCSATSFWAKRARPRRVCLRAKPPPAGLVCTARKTASRA